VIVATGLNDVLAGALPRYEPFYLYLGAIALVVFLDGVLFGVFCTLLALGFYALLFRRPDYLLPIVEAAGVVVVAGVIRGLVRRRRRAAEPDVRMAPAPQILLPAPAAPQDNTEVLTAIDVLRGELHEALADLARMRESRGDASRLEAELSASRAEAEVYAAERTRMQEYLDRARAGEEAERSRLGELRARVDELEAEGRAARTELDRALAERDASRTELDHARAEHDAERTRVAAEAGAESETLRQALDEARAEREQLESSIHAAREEGASLAGRVTELELALSAARARHAAHVDEIDGLRRALDTEHARAIALSGDVNDERTRIATLLADVELERGRVAAERALRERIELDAAGRDEESQRLRIRMDELEQGLAETTGAAETETAELRRALEAERQRADAALEERQRVEAEFDEKLQTIVGHLAADHEADLGKAVEEREEARAEARSVSLKISVVQRKMDEERAAISAKLRDADERHRRALDESARILADLRSAAQKEIEALRARLAELENRAPSAAPTTATGRPRLLIVYPDAELRTTARGLLERSGYDVISAADGLEAMRLAIAQQPHVVIADAVMPKMNGRELCQLLKSQEKTARIRVILLTRAGDDPPHGDFPPDEVLRKPVPLETLKATLASLLGLRIEN
jgi:CheY-like chemotaxis protein